MLIKKYFVTPFQMSWQSMYSTIYDREILLTHNLTSNYNRWDIIIMEDELGFYLKRIIWLPNEELKINNWKVFIFNNGDFIELDEKYLNDNNKNSTYIRWDNTEKIYIIPEWNYFVMWDNRNASTDSRTCFSSCDLPWKTNFIHKNDLMWKVFVDLGYFNISKFSFKQPDLWIDTTPKFFSSAWSYDYK